MMSQRISFGTRLALSFVILVVGSSCTRTPEPEAAISNLSARFEVSANLLALGDPFDYTTAGPCVDVGSASLAANASDPNPLVPLWAGILRIGLDSTKCWHVLGTQNGLPSILFLFTNAPPPSKDNPSAVQQVWALTHSIATGTFKIDPPKNCGSNNIDANTCCLQSPYPGCIATYSWSFCGRNDICKGAQKLGGAYSILTSFARELGKNSTAITKAQLFQGSPGDKVFFLWPYTYIGKTGEEPLLLRTEITGDLIDRLYVVANAALPTVRRLADKNRGSTFLTCSVGEQDFADFALSSEEVPEVFYSGIGRESSVATPPGTAMKASMSLYVEVTDGASHIAPIATIKDPVGSGNSEFIRFSEIGRDYPDRPFDCLPGVKMGDIYRLRSLMNNPEASTFIFGAAFLRAFFIDAY